MKIQEIFSKDLHRSINGVVKAEQQAQEVVWQELEEYVITRELRQHLEKFFRVYLKSMDQPNDASIAGQIGVWISGFFGSGKSHFIKILSYLLENREVSHSETGTDRKAIEFFEEKIKDPLFFGDIKRSITDNTDVILFNIDTKADHKDGRNAILNVFLRVLNEKQGFSGDYPHIAKMENHLHQEGKLEIFHQVFKELDGSDWVKNRDAYGFKESIVVEALSKALEISQQDAQTWFDKAEEQYSLTIENFAKQVKSYLDQKGPNHRILFLVDEVGQFIGDDSPLMLNLQTITENLGTVCGGRAWILVTSQEDIDTILGEFKRNKEQDFSKIQGRFTTRLSLSSSNTDEVIQKRLLLKTNEARSALENLFAEKGDILKHQLSFINTGATLKNYSDAESFTANYPFAPYHFQLVQKVFESIRKVGATGRHLSRGERSMLDAFQLAAQTISDQPLGTLVPLYHFYQAIEGFLDTAVSRTIKQAEERPLEVFDIQLLRVLFLIRYVDIMKPNVDNLVTLCIDQVDADRLQLRKQSEESLQRLEKETLISRSGDLYYFLTNEEQDVSREIKMVNLEGNEDIQEMSRLIFEEVLKGNNKYRYPVNKTDYGFARLCDGHPWKGKLDQELILEIITPLSEQYDWYIKEKCITRSIENNGRCVVKIANPPELGRELRTWLQTDKYIRVKSDSSIPQSMQKILRDRQEENRDRQKRLIPLMETLLSEAEYYAMGQSIEMKVTTAQAAIDQSIHYLLQNIFPKLGYLKASHSDPQKEIKAILHTSDVTQIEMVSEEVADSASSEISQFIELKSDQHHRLLLSEVVERFSRRPFGWPEWEIMILAARLAASQSITLMQGTSPLSLEEAQDYFCKTAKWKLVSLHKRRLLDKSTLEKARKLGQQLFGQIGPDAEKELFVFLKDQLSGWKQQLESFKHLAETGNYPGNDVIHHGIAGLLPLLAHQDSYQFIEAFLNNSRSLEDLSEDFHDLKDFYQNQKSTWERLIQTKQGLDLNKKDLHKDSNASTALQRMEEILAAKHPYNMIKEVDTLIATVQPINDTLIQTKRNEVDAVLENMIQQIKTKLDAAKADSALSNRSLKPVQDLRKHIQSEIGIPSIHYAQHTAQEILEEILFELEKIIHPPDVDDPPKIIKEIRPAQFVSKPYIETQEEVENFVKKLREELLHLIHDNKRIRIL